MSLRTKPTIKYSGLTVVLAKPSRFDRNELLSGYAGKYFSNALRSIPRQSCDIRESLDGGFLPETKTVLLLGQESLDLLRKDTSIYEQRGCPWTTDNKIFVATIAPQDAVDRQVYFSAKDAEPSLVGDDKATHGKTRRTNFRFWAARDIQKAVNYLKEPPEVINPSYKLWPNSSDVINILTNTKGQDLFFDIETNRQLEMTCFGFSFNEKEAWCVPMVVDTEYSYDDTHKILRALAIAFRDNTVVIHNALFDLFVTTARYGLPTPIKIYDTMLAHHRCFPEVEKSLGHCLSLYTDQPYHKNEGVFEPRNHAQREQLYKYNAKDVISLALLKPRIDAVAKNFSAVESIKQANSMIRPYLTATLFGINYDVEKLKAVIEHNQRYQKQVARMLELMTGQEFNPNSPKQVSHYLYNHLRLPKPNKDLTNEKTLIQLQLKHKVPAIAAILRYRSTAKENGQLKFPPYDGIYSRPTIRPRATTAYNLAGTTTFRLSSRRLLGKWGTNLQNIPKKLRHLFIPDPGKVFVQVDQSGAEALIVAYLCCNGNFRQLFLSGIKSHVYVALHLFADVWRAETSLDIDTMLKTPIEKLKDDPNWPTVDKLIKESDNWSSARRFYFIAKMVCHASNYGMKAPTFRVNVLQKSEGTINLTNAEALQFLTTYHTLFQEISLWHSNIIEILKRKRVLKNLFGYPRLFTGILEPATYKEAYAFIPQSTVGCITNIAFTELQHRVETDLKDFHVDILQNNHDSILLQCPPRYAKTVAQEVQFHLNRKLTSPTGESFQMKSEAMVGDNWGDMKDVY